MDLPVGMRIIYNIKHRYALYLKIRDKILTSLIKLVCKAKASICYKIKENLTLDCLCITKKYHLQQKPLTLQMSH